MSKVFQRRTKLRRVQFVVFEKVTIILIIAYLFQIAREKSCDFLLIICSGETFETLSQLDHVYCRWS